MNTPFRQRGAPVDGAERVRRRERRVEAARRAARAALEKRGETVAPEDRESLRLVAGALRELASAQQENGLRGCRETFVEALNLARRAGDQAGEITCAILLGNAILESASVADLAQAEKWYFHALQVAGKENGLVQGKCYNNLGEVETERYEKARAGGERADELERLIKNRVAFHTGALAVLPAEARRDRGVAENGIGLALQAGGDVEGAVGHYADSIRCFEAIGDHHRAAGTRVNLARMLVSAKRPTEALAQAQAALDGFKACGASAEAEAREAEALVGQIKNRAR